MEFKEGYGHVCAWSTSFKTSIAVLLRASGNPDKKRSIMHNLSCCKKPKKPVAMAVNYSARVDPNQRNMEVKHELAILKDIIEHKHS